jgi:hypothetical protein
MISTALEFIHARKWVVELILFAVIVAAGWWFCHHLIDVGVQRERAAWMLKVEAANLDAAKAQGRADAAEHAAEGERNALADYIRDHPLHGSLAGMCRKQAGVPAATAADGRDEEAGAVSADVLAVPSGNLGSNTDEPDQLGMLGLLAARGDLLSAQVRECQSR